MGFLSRGQPFWLLGLDCSGTNAWKPHTLPWSTDLRVFPPRGQHPSWPSFGANGRRALHLGSLHPSAVSSLWEGSQSRLLHVTPPSGLPSSRVGEAVVTLRTVAGEGPRRAGPRARGRPGRARVSPASLLSSASPLLALLPPSPLPSTWCLERLSLSQVGPCREQLVRLVRGTAGHRQGDLAGRWPYWNTTYVHSVTDEVRSLIRQGSKSASR